MLLVEGNKVLLINTGEIGIVTSVIDDDMVNVLLDDFEIPVSVDDLRLANSMAKEQPKVKKEVTALNPMVIVNKKPNTNQGVFVGFETKYDDEGSPSKYFIYLINDNQADIIFNYELSLVNRSAASLNGLVKSNTAFLLGVLRYEQLNDNPQLYFELWASTTAGKGERFEKTIKIKVQQFLKKIKKAPVIHSEVHLYEIAIKLEEPKPTESLTDYTQRVSKSNQQQQLIDNYYHKQSTPDVVEKANFPIELDLHIESLIGNSKSMTNAEKLNLQIDAFEKYIEEAYNIGLESVFVIHGLGKGRLRDIISSRLIRNETIRTFKNDYHPKYGFGATEILFKKS
jgi:hypothetical protein